MIILVLKDGLGNQLFQYAAGRCLAEKLGTELKFDLGWFQKNSNRKYSLNNFLIEEAFASQYEKLKLRSWNAYSKVLNKAGIRVRRHRYFEKRFSFSPSFFATKNNSVIEGYWQSEKNFKPIESIIRKEFSVKNPADGLNLHYLDMIRSTNSVSLHIRRGDYIADQNINSIHGVCSLSYYKDAVNYIKSHVESPRFFIFSDDMDWVKNNLSMEESTVEYIDHNGSNDHEDLRLMYSCKHNIIANSSFSWWGAWLNNFPGRIVIAPPKWFLDPSRDEADIIPADWVRMTNQ